MRCRVGAPFARTRQTAGGTPATMTDAIAIERQDTADGGRYVARVAGRDEESYLTFRRLGPDLVVATHTYAPPALRGSGAARALVARLAADAREQGFRVRFACSYVAFEFDRHPDWADLIAD